MIPVNSHTIYVWQLMIRDICQIYALTLKILGESERQIKYLVVFWNLSFLDYICIYE